MNQKLRKMDDRDLDMVRVWRNDPRINKYMFIQNYISENSHKEWFNKKINDPLNYLLIYEEDDKATGFTQLKKNNEKAIIYEWGFYVDPDSVKGTGKRMMTMVIKFIFSELGADKIYGEVLDFNRASINLHQSLGFTQDRILKDHIIIESQYHDVICFNLLKNNWNNSIINNGK